MKVSEFIQFNYYNQIIVNDHNKLIDSLSGPEHTNERQLAISAYDPPFKVEDEEISERDLRISRYVVFIFDQLLPVAFPLACAVVAPVASLAVLPQAFLLTATLVFISQLATSILEWRTAPPEAPLEHYYTQLASYHAKAFHEWIGGRVFLSVALATLGTAAVKYNFVATPWVAGIALGLGAGTYGANKILQRWLTLEARKQFYLKLSSR